MKLRVILALQNNMANKLHLIYIPGLGDDKVTGQQKAISTWRLWGVTAELFQMHWADNEPWNQKLKRLLVRIDSLSAEKEHIGLIGASAGASAVINAFAARKNYVTGCVLIAGKVNRPETVGGQYHLQNPAFITSLRDCQKALASLDVNDRKLILSRYALADEIVHKPDSHILGARNRLVPTIGHGFTIGSQIIFGAPSFINFLKRTTQK